MNIDEILMKYEVDDPKDIPDDIWINEYHRCPTCYEELQECTEKIEAWGRVETNKFTRCPNC